MNSENKRLKTAVSAPKVKRPVAPPVYRPQAVPKVLQKKVSPVQSSPAGQTPRQPVAPPVYHPQPVPKVLQTKTKVQKTRQDQLAQPRPQPIAPPVYKPQPAPKALQQKPAGVPKPVPALRGSVSMRSIQRAEQRPFLLVWDPTSEGGNVKDKTLADDLPALTQRYGEAEVEKPGKGKTVGISSNSVIHILAHGSESDIADISSPGTVAQHLKKKFGESLKGKTVIFYACEIGGGNDNSFVKQVTDSLGQLGMGRVKVIGPINETITLGDGSTRVLKQKQTIQQAMSGMKAVKEGKQQIKANDERLFPYGEGWVGYESVYNASATALTGEQVQQIIRSNT